MNVIQFRIMNNFEHRYKNWKTPLQVFTIIEEQETLVQYTHSKKVLQIENSLLPASLPINPY